MGPLSPAEGSSASLGECSPVCLLCWHAIEPHEPVTVVALGGDRISSIAIEPGLAGRRDVAHQICVVLDDAAELTRAERRIALLAARGARNHAIAEEVGVSPSTVGRCLSRVYRKLGISGRGALHTRPSEPDR